MIRLRISVLGLTVAMLLLNVAVGCRMQLAPTDPVDALMLAARRNDVTELDRLLKSGVDINSKRDISGYTALHEAAVGGSADAVDFLVKHGANIDARDANGLTPLFVAISADDTEEAALALIRDGANTNLVDPDQSTPLEYARGFSRTRVVQLLSGKNK